MLLSNLQQEEWRFHIVNLNHEQHIPGLETDFENLVTKLMSVDGDFGKALCWHLAFLDMFTVLTNYVMWYFVYLCLLTKEPSLIIVEFYKALKKPGKMYLAM